MSRATNAVSSRRRRKRVLKKAKGYKGGRSRLFRTAVEAVRRGMAYSFAHRRKKKGDFRSLWIGRIKIAANERGLTYSRLIHGLNQVEIKLNRKMLADIAVYDPKGFDLIVKKVKDQEVS
ncbi:50S ribosomal protein L20 [PVC group bacterium (ex Bugula neritina AB1)]|nr:50S ribosomal protein L20 [PVC group bacterium (ex Bugula neritina AB1)]